LWNKSVRPGRRPAAGAVSGLAGAGHKVFKSMIRKSGYRFSDKIMLK
jgi:hypothetical protein